jgi:CDP-6-deoxy-D-xylo-4-hexulose-3-dehydrase
MSFDKSKGLEEELFYRELDSKYVPPPEIWVEEAEKRRKQMDKIKADIKNLVERYINLGKQPKNICQIELAQSSFGVDEIWAGIEPMLDDYMTMGPRTFNFEKDWSQWLGVPFSLMVNSGSSANLLAVSALAFKGMDKHLKPGDEIIVPSIAWSTSIFPIIQNKCVPVFVDVDLETMTISVDEVKKALSPKTRGILPIHLLGNPADMKSLMDIAKNEDLFVVEDCCESHGAEIDNVKVGKWGDLGTFSFFFSHHITTVEGGMVSVKDIDRWGDLLISLRAHGWIRGRSDHDEWVQNHPDIDSRWLFVAPGYNVRPTDISAAFGQIQLNKLPGFIFNRTGIRNYWLNNLMKRYEQFLGFQIEKEGHFHSGFGFALRVKDNVPFTKKDFQDYLESRGVQTRPLISGNFTFQPVMKHIEHRIVGTLENASKIHHQGLMISNFHSITPSQQDYFLEVMEDFFKKYEH